MSIESLTEKHVLGYEKENMPKREEGRQVVNYALNHRMNCEKIKIKRYG